MLLFYSPTHGGFYNSGIHEALPSDAVEISDAEWRALLAGQARGQRIVPDASGRPVLVDMVVPAPTADAVKFEASRRIAAVMPDWMIAREVSGGDPIPQSVKDYAAAVRKASDTLEAVDPIPPDYTDDRHWPPRSNS